ncbi:ANTAR domain-containing protein [Nocardia sp. BMG111209]|uniref:ANTAR domain-containing protein n=1 Tax=Nocardia sp. BMG111209 TaxID=1160137 RepID=UPI001E3BBF58|nr:ANTAR domain-containing protein [Nocardia sp. BMG111209]
MPRRLRGAVAAARTADRRAEPVLHPGRCAVARGRGGRAGAGRRGDDRNSASTCVARHESINEQLQSALNSRIILEQAKGVLAERGGLDMEQAFIMLRTYARNTNTRLAEAARAIVDGTVDTKGLLSAAQPDPPGPTG